MTERKYLGTVRKDFKESKSCHCGHRVYISKHAWDCNWYWSFGYLDSRYSFTHFDGEFLYNCSDYLTPDKIFSDTPFSEKEWWMIRDLMVQAYALEKCAEVYQYGGHQTTVKGVTDIIANKEKADMLNKDLKEILDKMWSIIESH
jgi:hypothetical protein